MATNKNEQEETTIDKLNENLSSASEKIANNKNVIFWVIGGVAVIAALIVSYIFLFHNPKVNKAFEAYNQVEISAAGNDSLAAAQYKKVADEYSSTDAGHLAALSAAEAYYNTGKYKEATACLEDFKTSEPVLKSNAKILLGDCYVNLKQYDKAIGAYDDAISIAGVNDQIVPRALLKEANIYDSQKKYEQAFGCYEKISKEYPNFQTGNGMSIDAYIAREKARLGK